MTATSLNTQSAILDRALTLHATPMTPDVARFLVSIQLGPFDVQRANELAAKARDGSLTIDEQTEIDEYRRAGRTIEMLKLRAKASLA